MFVSSGLLTVAQPADILGTLQRLSMWIGQCHSASQRSPAPACFVVQDLHVLCAVELHAAACSRFVLHVVLCC